MIELSHNEASSLIKLAARGVGYPWGLGEEAAHIGHWLAERQLPALTLFRSLFTWVDEREFCDLILQTDATRWRCSRGELCPIVCGTALVDSANILLMEVKLELENVVSPLLLMPFVSEASIILDKPIRMSWRNVELVLTGTNIDTVHVSHAMLKDSASTASPATICISVVNDSTDASISTHDSDVTVEGASRGGVWPVVGECRVSTDIRCLTSLKQFAYRTYAPATELSRISGAGAGTTDND